MQQIESPFALHECGLSHELSLLIGRSLMAARSGLMVNEICIRRPNIPQTSRAQAQAEIDVVETDRKIRFIESAGLFENFPAHEQARAGHGRAILLQPGAIEITRMPVRHPWKGMTRH